METMRYYCVQRERETIRYRKSLYSLVQLWYLLKISQIYNALSRYREVPGQSGTALVSQTNC